MSHSEQQSQELEQVKEILEKHSNDPQLPAEIQEAYRVTLEALNSDVQTNVELPTQERLSFDEIKENTINLFNFAYDFALEQTKNNKTMKDIIPQIQSNIDNFFSSDKNTTYVETYQPPIPVLPSVQQEVKLSPVQINHKMVALSGVLGLGVGSAVALMASAGILFAILYGFSFMAIAYSISLMSSLIKRAQQFEKQQKQKNKELLPRYNRYRVGSSSQQGKIILQLEEFTPAHQEGDQTPFYFSKAIKSLEFELEQEVELYEALAELQLEAEQKEEEALKEHLRVEEALTIQTNLQKFLQTEN